MYQQQQHQQQQNQVFHAEKVDHSPQAMINTIKTIPEIQWFGFIVTILLLVFVILLLILKACLIGFEPLTIGIYTFSNTFDVLFFLIILIKKDYLKGNPDRSKMWPLMVALFFRFIAFIISVIKYGDTILLMFPIILYESFYLFALFLIYFSDDNSESCCKILKPYAIKATNSDNHSQ